MALVLADRVKESSTTTGTGTFTLAGAVTGYQTFSAAIGNTNTCYYTIAGQTTNEWEVGIGTVGAGTLARTTILSSSNAGSVVTFSAGTKDVFVTYPADKSINQDASGNVGIGTTTPTALLHVSNAAAKIRIGLDASSQYLDISRDNATGFSIYNAAQTSFSAHIFQIVGTERFRIATNGTISLGAAPGTESLRVTPVASAVNYWNFYGGAASGAVQVYANGSDTNIPINYVSKGTGSHLFYTNGPSSAPQFNIANTASAVNYLQVTGGATGGVPLLQATGTDTNVPLTIVTKGTGYINLQTGGGTQFVVTNTASAVNYLQVTGSTTTNDPTISAVGTDTNIDVQIVPKGTGGLRFAGPLLPNNLAGTSGQVLTSAGAGAVPTWTTPASGGGGFEQVFLLMGA